MDKDIVTHTFITTYEGWSIPLCCWEHNVSNMCYLLGEGYEYFYIMSLFSVTTPPLL